MAKFTGDRYATIGIQTEIPLELQIILWGMIDDNIRTGLKMDYLQVFELSATYKNGELVQEITHKQEQPRRRKTVTVSTNNPVNVKIFVIDDVTHSTMLLSNEY